MHSCRAVRSSRHYACGSTCLAGPATTRVLATVKGDGGVWRNPISLPALADDAVTFHHLRRNLQLALPQNTAGRDGKKHASTYIVQPYSHKATLAARNLLDTEGDAKIIVTFIELLLKLMPYNPQTDTHWTCSVSQVSQLH